MRIKPEIIKKYVPFFLLPIVRYCYCIIQELRTRTISKREYPNNHLPNLKKKVLIYGVWALGIGGTEKNLQMIAKYLDRESYDVYFMYGTKARRLWNYNTDTIERRREYLWEENIVYIPFDYTHLSDSHPYEIRNMSPHILDAIRFYNIDLVITAWAGNAEFPLTMIPCPIILLNIFGIPNTIKKINYHVCISQTIADEISDIVPDKKIKTFYIPTEWPKWVSLEDRENFRKEYNLPRDALVFGRIGRADDAIYDPIGILAFEKIVQKYPHIHYAIVSPSNALRNYVLEKNIPNVHFIDPIYDEKEVWIFHKSIDVLAHFRYDWETFGLNIAESMMCGNPIITHRSKIWNAHLEYLSSDNSFVADIDNIWEYALALEFFAKDVDGIQRKKMWLSAKTVAEKLFHIDSYMEKFHLLIEDSLRKLG